MLILKRSSYLNLKKKLVYKYIRLGAADPEIVTVRKDFLQIWILSA
jgi:hypothetical protein